MNSDLVFKVKCSACATTCSHKLMFSNEGIEHLGCSECGVVDVFAFEVADGEEEDKKKKKELSVINYVSVIEQRGSKSSDSYSIKNDYTDGDYLSHSKFGDGYVLSVVPPNKMTVMFAEEKKLLICGPGSKPAAIKMSKAKKKTSKKKPASIKVATPTGDEPTKCPKCDATVHPYNLAKNPKGKIVGCMHCATK